MLKIALTGNIASGKSTVQKMLESKGFKVLDTDKTAHKLLDNMPEIIKEFQDYDILEGGKISREKLGRIIFADKKLKKRLEEIIHPAVKKEIIEFFTRNNNETLTFVGIPLLFESDMQDLFDKTLLIYTDDDIRFTRLLLRNNYTREYAKQRMQSQLPQDTKCDLCDYVIYNNGTFEDLENSVNDFLYKLKPEQIF